MPSEQLISPARQKEWGVLAVTNFVLGGAGTGAYFINWTTTFFNRPFSEQNTSVPYDLFSLSIVAFGFLCVAVESGRPFRGYHIFSGLGKSWVSREVLAFTVFMLVIFMSHLSRHRIFDIMAAVSAICFMIFQGLIVYSARSIPLWNSAFIPFIFLSSGLASGAGVSLFFAMSDKLMSGSVLPILSLFCVAFNLALWFLYLRWCNTVSIRPVRERPALNRYPLRMVFTVGISHILAILLLILLWKIQANQGAGGLLKGVLVVVSSLTIIIGVSAQKAWIVISAGYNRKIALKF